MGSQMNNNGGFRAKMADLLPEVVPGYKPPSRLYPLSGRSKLTDTELIHLRKQAYHLPTHFFLGHEKYKAITSAYYQGTFGALFVYGQWYKAIRPRTVKGKRVPPPCKESDIAGEVIKILREDGDPPVGYGDALTAILPSFPEIKKLQ
ncbi:hypothetical protein M8C21_018770 [Ambrosia artemisiifolia]|uniref:Uncharacterized protein n=1 Tax=Ambrosia artemisiifolia TaxID=4212 RepID=A0AAD5CZR6_AMBAR|nr:hypothetical protein M8C21_018770 [Ambrosia artemisiifolia]